MARQPRSKRLSVVLDLTRREKDDAARELEMAQQYCEQERAKLAQLEAYYADYQQDFAGAATVRVEQLMTQRNFLQQLSLACKQQQAAIQMAEQALGRKRDVWQRAHLKHKNLAELIARYQTQEQAELGKKEQQMLDEWFQQSRTRR